jgi:hypothetical protein
MKSLDEYLTPETDAAISGEEFYASKVIDTSRNLEQRLAACRDALNTALETMELVDGENDCSKAIRICDLTLTLTTAKP